MKVIDATGEQPQISFSRDELLIVNAALNETCNGLDILEFETRVGFDRGRVAALLKEVGALLDMMSA